MIQSVSVTSEEVVRQIRAVTDPLSQQLAHLCELMREHRNEQANRRHKETASSRAASSSSSSVGWSDNNIPTYCQQVNRSIFWKWYCSCHGIQGLWWSSDWKWTATVQTRGHSEWGRGNQRITDSILNEYWNSWWTRTTMNIIPKRRALLRKLPNRPNSGKQKTNKSQQRNTNPITTRIDIYLDLGSSMTMINPPRPFSLVPINKMHWQRKLIGTKICRQQQSNMPHFNKWTASHPSPQIGLEMDSWYDFSNWIKR